ncbi:MAG: hypothetical protein M1833_006805 [Piccolia ochrophora]|nr:MAG: hypothetical protein M1833_006805 [Piccolia ochrophora]
MLSLSINLPVWLVLVSTGIVHADWRLECRARTGLARIDPLMQFGRASQHVHAIFGGNNFGVSSSNDDLRSSSCTSCKTLQDKSAYWSPALYFEHEGTKQYELVDQPGGGDLAVYYFLRSGGKQTIEAFPPDFRMIAGDSMQRSYSGGTGPQSSQDQRSGKALGFNCLNYNLNSPGPKPTPEDTLDRQGFPEDWQRCKDGIRFELVFPSCWNGQSDSDDHRSHVAYPDTVQDGSCPEGFNKRLPTMLFESIWTTQKFIGKPGRFVIANGDPTGYGYHGDFMNGWDQGTLQQAIANCKSQGGDLGSCGVFTPNLEPAMRSCSLKSPAELANEDCKGPRQGLPGGVQVSTGPGRASSPGGGAGSQGSIDSPQQGNAGPGSNEQPANVQPADVQPANEQAANGQGGSPPPSSSAAPASSSPSTPTPSPQVASDRESGLGASNDGKRLPGAMFYAKQPVNKGMEDCIAPKCEIIDGKPVVIVEHVVTVYEDETTGRSPAAEAVAANRKRHLEQHHHRVHRHQHGRT